MNKTLTPTLKNLKQKNKVSKVYTTRSQEEEDEDVNTNAWVRTVYRKSEKKLNDKAKKIN